MAPVTNPVLPPKGTRVKGHALTLTWSGEYGDERSSTGSCTCGWAESASNQNKCRYEYRWHLANVLWRQAKEA
jgi:hypothetical protein